MVFEIPSLPTNNFEKKDEELEEPIQEEIHPDNELTQQETEEEGTTDATEEIVDIQINSDPTDENVGK